ncbi:hypothetical protein [Marinovum sp.]|uniref:hypothetical protein n=1 Tax=Marinovum sp. TaxID=2024839 RepID=UPI002B26B680|nr:hypothetical protein [Marinovum sp.]
MKSLPTCAAAILAAVLAAPVVAQDAYGQKGYVEVLGGTSYVEEIGGKGYAEEYGSKGYVAAETYAPVRTRVRVAAVPVQQVAVVLPGCVMGLGVMQRGTLICPGH